MPSCSLKEIVGIVTTMFATFNCVVQRLHEIDHSSPRLGVRNPQPHGINNSAQNRHRIGICAVYAAARIKMHIGRHSRHFFCTPRFSRTILRIHKIRIIYLIIDLPILDLREFLYHIVPSTLVRFQPFAINRTPPVGFPHHELFRPNRPILMAHPDHEKPIGLSLSYQLVHESRLRFFESIGITHEISKMHPLSHAGNAEIIC